MTVKQLLIFAPRLSYGGIQLIKDIIITLESLGDQFQNSVMITTQNIYKEYKNISVSLCRTRGECEREAIKLYNSDCILLNFSNIPILRALGRNDFNEVIFFQNILLCSVDPILHNWNSYLKMRFFRFICLLYSHKFKFIVQSQNVKKLLVTVSPKSQIKICKFVPNYIIRNDLRKYNFKKFIYVSSDYPHKNNERLLQAWGQIDSPNAKLVVIIPGGFKIAEKYKNLVNLNVITNALDNKSILEMIQKADCLVYPSLTESFGLPLMEAMKFEIKIIASRRDFVWEVCNPIDSFEPLDIESIRASLMRVMGVTEENSFVCVKDFLHLVSSVYGDRQ